MSLCGGGVPSAERSDPRGEFCRPVALMQSAVAFNNAYDGGGRASGLQPSTGLYSNGSYAVPFEFDWMTQTLIVPPLRAHVAAIRRLCPHACGPRAQPS